MSIAAPKVSTASAAASRTSSRICRDVFIGGRRSRLRGQPSSATAIAGLDDCGIGIADAASVRVAMTMVKRTTSETFSIGLAPRSDRSQSED